MPIFGIAREKAVSVLKTIVKSILPRSLYARAESSYRQMKASARDKFWESSGVLPSRQAILNLSNAERTRALARSVLIITTGTVTGDIVEFGTMSGLTAAALARAMTAANKILPHRRALHLFDSFEGLPESTSAIDQAQPLVQSGAWAKGELKGMSPQKLHSVCGKEYDPARVKTYKGWFAETVPHLPSETRLALLHVDGDLYQSCVDCLEPCLANGWISEGAIIHFDDWNVGRASDALGERRAWKELVERYDIRFEFGGFYAEAGSWIIVHDYRGRRD
jgi:O-methyltransferase